MATIEAFGLTDVGKKRKHNEDAFALDEDEGLFIVADGMGGHAAGEVAAKITVETIAEFIAATRQKEEATWPFKYNHELDFNSNRLAIAIEKANERVMSAVAAQPWLKGMGTTVVAGLLNDKILSLAHVGDSRAYLYRAGELTRLTDDHSWVHEQVSAGILTEDEAKTHPLKNVVTRALGGGPSVAPDLREMEFSPGDEFLFCSDGLTTMLSDEEIRDAAAADEKKDPKVLCQGLVDLANEKGGVDNITVVLVRIKKPAAPAKAAGRSSPNAARRSIRTPIDALTPEDYPPEMANPRRFRPLVTRVLLGCAAVLWLLAAQPGASRLEETAPGRAWVEDPARRFGPPQTLLPGRALLLDEAEDPEVRSALALELRRLYASLYGTGGWRVPFAEGEPLRVYLARRRGEGVRRMAARSIDRGELVGPADSARRQRPDGGADRPGGRRARSRSPRWRATASPTTTSSRRRWPSSCRPRKGSRRERTRGSWRPASSSTSGATRPSSGGSGSRRSPGKPAGRRFCARSGSAPRAAARRPCLCCSGCWRKPPA